LFSFKYLTFFLNTKNKFSFSIYQSFFSKVCGVPTVVNDGFRMLKPGGIYLFIGMVHPHSKLDITGEQIIRKCLMIKGIKSFCLITKPVCRLLCLGIHNYAPRHLDQAVQFLAKTINKYPYEEIMGPTYDLSNLPSAMQAAIAKQYSRILVKPDMLTT